jgi:flagellar biosynthesis protein FlhG
MQCNSRRWFSEEGLHVLEGRAIIDQATGLRQFASLYAQKREEQSARVLAVTSGKGGVGKSTIALNLGISIGMLGKRVLIVDGDANLGSLDVMAGVTPGFRIDEAIRGACRAEDAMLEICPGVVLIPGSSGDPAFTSSTDQQRERFVRTLSSQKQGFDFVIVDTGSGLHPEVLSYATLSNEALIVTTPEPASIIDAYAMMKVLTSRREDQSFNVIVNHARTLFEAEETMLKLRLALQHFLSRDFRYLGYVPFDPVVRVASDGQTALMRAAPASAAARAVQALASKFVSSPLQSQNRTGPHE